MSPPLLSIIIPTYNSEQFLSQTIQSILNQTYKNFELIIINDGSTDSSKSIIESFNDTRIKYYENKKNKGIVFTRNYGLQLAKGEYIGMVDSDDIVYPEKFEEQITFLEKNKDFGMVGSWVKFIDVEGKRLSGSWKLNAPPEMIPSIMLFNNYFVQSAVLSRRESISRFTFKVDFPTAQDYLMWVEVTQNYKTWNLPKYMLDYRVHKGGITEKHKEVRSEKEKEIFRMQLKRLEIDATDKELELHSLIKDDRPITQINTLKSIEEWLLKIISKNKTLKVYDHRMLTKVVYNRWLKVCNKSSSLHFLMLYKLISSQILFNFIKNYNPFNKKL